jgi:hypothetical protein
LGCVGGVTDLMNVSDEERCSTGNDDECRDDDGEDRPEDRVDLGEA